jgi:hypothetical protein
MPSNYQCSASASLTPSVSDVKETGGGGEEAIGICTRILRVFSHLPYESFCVNLTHVNYT